MRLFAELRGVLISALIFLGGCDTIIADKIESCIRSQLLAMAEADLPGTSWSPELYKAVAETCKELHKRSR